MFSAGTAPGRLCEGAAQLVGPFKGFLPRCAGGLTGFRPCSVFTPSPNTLPHTKTPPDQPKNTAASDVSRTSYFSRTLRGGHTDWVGSVLASRVHTSTPPPCVTVVAGPVRACAALVCRRVVVADPSASKCLLDRWRDDPFGPNDYAVTALARSWLEWMRSPHSRH
jgi:hypothetical protein